MVVLVVVAHPDDESIGCGATLGRFAREGHEVYCGFLADGVSSRQSATVLDAMRRWTQWAQALRALGVRALYPHRAYPDQQLDAVPQLVLSRQIEAWIGAVQPTQVYTHSPTDANGDHRAVWGAVEPAVRHLPREAIRRVAVRQMRRFCHDVKVAVSAEDRLRQRDALLFYGDECAKDAADLVLADGEDWFELPERQEVTWPG